MLLRFLDVSAQSTNGRTEPFLCLDQNFDKKLLTFITIRRIFFDNVLIIFIFMKIIIFTKKH